MRAKRGSGSSSEMQVASVRDDQSYHALLHHTRLPSSQAAGRNSQIFPLSAPERKSPRASPVYPAGKVTHVPTPSPGAPCLRGGSDRSKALQCKEIGVRNWAGGEEPPDPVRWGQASPEREL